MQRAGIETQRKYRFLCEYLHHRCENVGSGGEGLLSGTGRCAPSAGLIWTRLVRAGRRDGGCSKFFRALEHKNRSRCGC